MRMNFSERGSQKKMCGSIIDKENTMKTAIIYYSQHHGNTKKLVDAIASEFEVTLINVVESNSVNLTGYDTFGPFKVIGGIAKGHPNKEEIASAVSFYRKIKEY